MAIQFEITCTVSSICIASSFYIYSTLYVPIFLSFEAAMLTILSSQFQISYDTSFHCRRYRRKKSIPRIHDNLWMLDEHLATNSHDPITNTHKTDIMSCSFSFVKFSC